MPDSSRKLLIVEDDTGLQRQLRWCFDQYHVVFASTRAAALDKVRSERPGVVTLDLGLPPDADGHSEGLLCLEQILAVQPHTKVIVVTGNDDRANAVHAIGLGAFDFYHKPIDTEILSLIVDRAQHVHELEAENQELLRQQPDSPLAGVLASHPDMLKVCANIEKIAPCDATVLLLGESGTGKELLARSLHHLSPRAKNRFVTINCAAIPEALLESELFGHEKGAFTGALKQTDGKIELADGGTLFLDEVGDLPLLLQAKLLRFLQERIIERVGGRTEIPVNVRVVCATHKDLGQLIQTREFREDLYYRISEITVRIPPLRERVEDVLLIARAFYERYSRQNGKSLRGFSQESLLALERYPWPGNVRELENRIKRGVIMAEGKYILPTDLELAEVADDTPPPTFDLRTVREQVERQTLLRALGHSGGKMAQAADLLGVSRPTLYDLMRKLNIKY